MANIKLNFSSDSCEQGGGFIFSEWTGARVIHADAIIGGDAVLYVEECGADLSGANFLNKKG